MGEGIYVYDIFRSILQFVGRGWFEQEANKCADDCCDTCSEDDNTCDMEECDIEENEDGADGNLKPAARRDGDTGNNNSNAQSRSSSRTRLRSSSDVDFTQFHLE
jgi:hypothetical protein